MNVVALIGRLTHDPRLSYTTSGKPVAQFGLAVDRRGRDEADFIDIVVWDKQAENVAQYMKKGRKVAVQGSLQTRNFEHNGQKRKAVEVVAYNVQFLDSPRDDG